MTQVFSLRNMTVVVNDFQDSDKSEVNRIVTQEIRGPEIFIG